MTLKERIGFDAGAGRLEEALETIAGLQGAQHARYRR
jgi:hypothetical protein